MKTKNIIVALILLGVLGASAYFVYDRYYKEEKIKIGVIIPLSGPQANYGKYIQNSLNMAIDEINSKSKKNKFELVFEDDEAAADKAVSAINKLINANNVQVTFGPWASSAALAVAPIAERNKHILMAEAISPKIKNAGDYIFRIQPDAKIYLNKLSGYIEMQRPELKRIGILYVNNDFGQDQAVYFKTKMEGLGRTIVFNESFEPNATDFRTAILKLKEQKVDAVFCPVYAELSNISIQLKEAGLNIQVFGSVPTENQSIIDAAKGSAEGVIYPYHFDINSENAAFREFLINYEKRFGQKPEGFASLAYDGIYILTDAINKGGTGNTEQIKAALYNTQGHQGINGIISFDKDGDVTMPIVIKQVKDSSFNVIWK